MNKLLTDNVRDVLQAQYPDEDLVEIDGCIYHLSHTQEAWEELRDKVRPGWGVMKECRGLEHYVIYNTDQYFKQRTNGSDYYHYLVCNCFSADIELPINCSSCFEMFFEGHFSDGFEFPETFDTSEVVDMREMFIGSSFSGNINFGEVFNTNKVKDFSNMFQEARIMGNLDLGPNFSLENADTVSSMFMGSIIKNPIKFGDKFNPKNARYLNSMFAEIDFPEGFNIGNNFHLGECCVVDRMFVWSKLNEDFWLPECFNVDKNAQKYLVIFEGTKLPKRINGVDRTDTPKIIEALKVRDNKNAMEYLSSI